MHTFDNQWMNETNGLSWLTYENLGVHLIYNTSQMNFEGEFRLIDMFKKI